MRIKKDLLGDVLICVVVLSATLLSLYIGFTPFEFVERPFYDLVMGVRPFNTSKEVVLIGIDDKSIERAEQWPLQRSLIAEAVNTIESLGAKAVALDILYSEKDRNPGLAEIRRMLKKLKEDPSQVLKKDILDLFPYLKMSRSEQKRYSDALLNASVAETQRILIALLSETEKRIDFDSLFTQRISETKNLLMPLEFSFGKTVKGPDILPPYMMKSSIPYECSKGIVEASSVLSPLDTFAMRAYGLGHINISPDSDGILRRHQLFVCYMQRLFPSLPLQSVIKKQGIALEDAYKRYIQGSHGMSGAAELFINFNVIGTLPYYSFSDLLAGSIPADRVSDRIVIIGMNNPRIKDNYRLSGEREVASLFVHGAVISGIINNDYITRPIYVLYYEAVFIVLLSLLTVIIARRYYRLMKYLLLLPLLWTVLCAYMLLYDNLLWKVSYPWAVILLLFPIYFIKGRFRAQENIEGRAKDVFDTTNLRFIIGAKSDIGRVRERNEDSFCVDKSLGILAVADGVGGHASGEIASKMALDVMRDFIRNKGNAGGFGSQTISAIMRDAIQAANTEIIRSASENPQLKGMATTLTAAYIKDSRVVIGHVGDSRIYLLRGGRLEQLTEDHTVATERNLRSLSAKDAEKMRHVLTRAIGIQPLVEVDTYELNITRGDALVLCTDGLYSMVADRDIELIIQSYREPDKACGALINEANRHGGKDNITLIVALVVSKD